MKKILQNKIINKFRYNILSGLNVLFLFIFNLAIGRVYGLSVETDIYFALMNFIYLLCVLVQIFYDAFFPYYTDEHKQRPKQAYSLLYALEFIIIAASLAIILCVLPFNRFFLQLYLAKMDASGLLLAHRFFMIIIWDLLLYNLILYNNRVINISFHYAFPYLFNIIAPAGTTILLLVFSHRFSLILLGLSTIFFHLVIVFLQIIYMVFFLKIRSRIYFNNKLIMDIIKAGVLIRLSGGLNQLLNNVILAFLARMGTGFITYYSYAVKFITTIFEVICNPVLTIFRTNIVHLISAKKMKDIPGQISRVYKKSVLFYLLCSILIVLILPATARTIFSHKISLMQVNYILYFFIGMIPVYFITLIAQPYNDIIIGFKEFRFLLIFGITKFVVVVALIYLLYIMRINFILVLIIALFAAQLINYFLRYRITKKLL